MAKICRVTMLFETGKHGWSETFYDDRWDDVPTAVQEAVKPGGLVATRLGILTANATLIGVRVTNVASPRESQRIVSPEDFIGAGLYRTAAGVNVAEDLTEEVFSALHFLCRTSGGRERPYLMRGVPDAIISPTNEYTPNPEWNRRLTRYRRVLTRGAAVAGADASGYSMRSTSTSTDVRVIGAADFVSADGRSARYTTTQAFEAPGASFANAFIIRGTPPAPGWIGTFRGKFVSDARLAVDLFATRQLASAPVIGGGNIAPLKYTYQKLQSVSPVDIRSRRTGGPFDRQRGRQPKSKFIH